MIMSDRGSFCSKRRMCVFRAIGLILLALMVLTQLLSCSKENTGDSSKGKKSSQKSSGTLPVRIVPETPTVADDLRATFVKSPGITYAWEINGIVMDGVSTPKLSRNLFAKHDIVTVVVWKGNEKGSATVVIGNTVPKVSSVSLDPVYVFRGVDITAVPVAVDADGDNVKFEGMWFVNGKELKKSSTVLSGDSFQRGDKISFMVRPLDDEGFGSQFITKEITIPNAQPHFVSFPPDKIEKGQYRYHVSAVDPDGDPLTYLLAVSPKGMEIDADTGILTWHAPVADSSVHQIEIVVRDSEGAQVSQKYTLNLTLSK